MVRSTMQTTKSFYDDFANYYDLIFDDWDRSMQRQGDFIAQLISDHHGDGRPIAVLDASAGIGTQSLPLAQRGFEVHCRDLSCAAITRLQCEADARGLEVDASDCDMRVVHTSLRSPVDVVLAFDNSVPHLLDDAAILRAFDSFFRCLAPDGVCLLSVRDYEQAQPGQELLHNYGIRWREGVRYIPFQVWRWLDETHYELTLHIVKDSPLEHRLLTFVTQYYAVGVGKLMALLKQAGFVDCQQRSSVYGPVLVARRARE